MRTRKVDFSVSSWGSILAESRWAQNASAETRRRRGFAEGFLGGGSQLREDCVFKEKENSGLFTTKMVCSNQARILIFLPQRTQRREISCPFLSWDSVEALKDHPGCPKSPSSKPKKNSVCSVSSVVKKIRSIHHEGHEDHEDWVGPEWATTRKEPERLRQWRSWTVETHALFRSSSRHFEQGFTAIPLECRARLA